MASKRKSDLARIFAAPLLIAALGLAGLFIALLGDGVFDVLSWVALGGSSLVIPLLAKLRR